MPRSLTATPLQQTSTPLPTPISTTMPPFLQQPPTTTTLTTNPELSRQQSLGLRIPRSVSVVGCGGVGSWVAVFLALAGVPELILWDGDTVSETNLNRLPLGPSYLGTSKVLALRHMLSSLCPRCSIIPFDERWSAEEANRYVPEVLVAATDSHASRVLMHTWAGGDVPDAPRCRYLEVSAEGEMGGVTDSPAMFTSDLERNPGYQSVPVWVGPCVMSAAMACSAILHTSHQSTFNLRLGFAPSLGRTELQNL